MCATCDTVRKQPVNLALRTIAATMRARRDSSKPALECLDRLMGKLIGVSDGEQDEEVNGLWEKGRR